MKKSFFIFLSVLTVLMFSGVLHNRAYADERKTNTNKLVVLWTSGDPDVAHRVCLMYAHAAKKNGWFDEVTLIIWGPSARLVGGDKDLQAKLLAMKKDGIKLQACIVCANSYGVTKELTDLGVEVKGMGKQLTEYLRSDSKILTF